MKKGAKAGIGWNASVSINHTDQATTQLFGQLILEKQTIREAKIETNDDVGPDPTYNSTLCYYPTKVGNYIIPTTTGKGLALNTFAQISEEQRKLKLLEHYPKKINIRAMMA